MDNQIWLKNIIDIDDVKMMKMIFSSGDYFPGFYKYTLGTQSVGQESLGMATFVFLYFEQKIKGLKHSKEDWLETQHKIYDREIVSENARNFRNFPDVRETMKDAMYEWYFNESKYDVFFMNTKEKVHEFCENQTYYFMGSMLRYSENLLHIGYDDFLKSSVMKLKVPFEEVKKHLSNSFKEKWIEDLFLKAEVIAQLSFENENQGAIDLHEDQAERYLNEGQEFKIFAVPSKSRHLPIRFAKHIRLTNFTISSDGTFSPWNQN